MQTVPNGSDVTNAHSSTCGVASPKHSPDPTWCYWCDRSRTDCACHLDPNGLPEGHWSQLSDDPPCTSVACTEKRHYACTDIDGNCCDCTCHLNLSAAPPPMADAEALAKAQRIWGPNVAVQHDISIGCYEREAFVVIVWGEDKTSAKVVASSFCHASCSDAPASWEAMFAKAAGGAL